MPLRHQPRRMPRQTRVVAKRMRIRDPHRLDITMIHKLLSPSVVVGVDVDVVVGVGAVGGAGAVVVCNISVVIVVVVVGVVGQKSS